MDRLARSLVDLHTLVQDLVSRGVSVRFLREGQTYWRRLTRSSSSCWG
ncbi:recombinase family protein [Corynebacterium ureicelerivorans]|nr:recombinase family protein [Corynebacterium ureicelerivorans]MDN8627316.1 recombinase family protein [Corynebacterium ureicelerivorans]